eukprot:1702208-Amphidinium_carterae.1
MNLEASLKPKGSSFNRPNWSSNTKESLPGWLPDIGCPMAVGAATCCDSKHLYTNVIERT